MNRTAVVTGTPRIGPNDVGSDGDGHAGIGSAIGGAIAHEQAQNNTEFQNGNSEFQNFTKSLLKYSERP